MSRRDRWDVYERHAATVRRFVARRVEPDAVDDVVAETFAIAWRRLPRDGETPEWLLPWLYGVAKRAIHGHRRSHARRGKLLARVAGHRDAAAAPDSADLIVDDPQLARAFAKLTEQEREAIRLIAWECLSPDDAAKVAGCSPPTFAVRYSRARKRLAAALDPPTAGGPSDGIPAPTPAAPASAPAAAGRAAPARARDSPARRRGRR